MAQIIRQSIDEYLGGLHRPDEQELRRRAVSIIDRELRRFILAMPAQAGPRRTPETGPQRLRGCASSRAAARLWASAEGPGAACALAPIKAGQAPTPWPGTLLCRCTRR